MSDELDASRLERFSSVLATSSSLWANNKLLWRAFAEAFPAFAGAADQRRWFLAALRDLEERGVIQLPPAKGRRWDRTFGVAVPTSVYLVKTPQPASPSRWKVFPWHSRLQWVAELPRLSAEQVEFLLEVHHGLVHGKFTERAPLKYRSLQLTGREKRLGELASTALFAAGRLDFDLLGCYPETPPLAIERVGEAPVLVLFENADAFAVARDVLKKLPKPPYGMVGFGGGNGLCRSLPYLSTYDHPLERVEYVGDLDYFGLRIAASTAAVAERKNLAPFRPATRLHQAMLDSASRFGHTEGWPEDEAGNNFPRNDIQRLVRFMDESLHESIIAMLGRRHRIPEEVLGPEELAAVWDV